MIEAAIKTILSEDTAVAELIGDRVFAGVAEQKQTTTDFVCFWSPEDGRSAVTSLEGDVWLVKDRFYILTVAKGFAKYKTAAEIDTAIFKALQEFAGTVGDIEIQGIFAMEQPQHAYRGYDDQLQHHRFLSAFEVSYLLTR